MIDDGSDVVSTSEWSGRLSMCIPEEPTRQIPRLGSQAKKANILVDAYEPWGFDI